jgi:hypothetical protein
MVEDGFNGIAVIGWDAEILKWILFKSSDGEHSNGMRVRSKRIANQAILVADRFNARHYYNGHMIRLFNFICNVAYKIDLFVGIKEY